MLSLPRIIERPEHPYVAIPARMPLAELPRRVPPLFHEIWEWVTARNAEPAEGSFIKYNVVDMEGETELEVGVPLRRAVEGDGRVLAGTLPAGRYATIVYRGPYEALFDVNAVLFGWAQVRGIAWDSEKTPAGERLACRLEIYKTDPQSEPNPVNWETEVTFRLADGQ